MQPLLGRRALVTGGAGGLGSEICAALGAAGAHVAIGYRTQAERAEEVADIIRTHGGGAFTVPIDIADPASIAKGVATARLLLDGLDILVNNAATTRRPEGTGIAAITPDYWDEMMGTNLRGPLLMAQAAAPHLAEAGPGHIVNIGSTIGAGRFGAELPFSVSKAAIAPLTRYLAATLAPHVMVNCVAPGLMEGTGLTARAAPEFVDTWKGAAASGRTTSLADVAAQVVTCCASTTMTGQTVVIDGGIHFE